MKAKELRPLFKSLLSSMPGFTAHKSLLLMTPMHGILRAIDFDSSAFDKATFYPAAFVMPLLVPKDYLTLNFGRRLRHGTEGEQWAITMPNVVDDLSQAIHEQAIPFLSRAETLLGFTEMAADFAGNPHTPKEIAFALARAGETERAIAGIDAYLPTLDLRSHWQQTIFDQSTELRALLVKDPVLAQAKLSEWQAYTIQKLGLEKFR